MVSSTVVLVTGANTGIGYEIVKALLDSAQSYHILLGSRSQDKAHHAIETLHNECPKTTSTVRALQVDLTSDKSIEKAFEQVKASPGHIDVLINNAGAAFNSDFNAGKISLRDTFNKAYDVNVAGTHVLTSTFMPLLLKSNSPRLIFIAGLSQITVAAQNYFPTPPQPSGWPKNIDFDTITYRCSKTALNMLMLDWEFKLREDRVKVWGVGPGFLATNLGGLGPEKVREMGGGHPRIGGVLVRSVVEGDRDGDVGKIVGKDGLIPW